MPKYNLKIKTERLIIRPFELKDIQASYELNLDSEVSRYTSDGGVVSREEIERRIKEDVFGDYEKYGFGRLAVEVKGENKFIGFTGLKYIPEMDEVDLGYRFMKKYWGKGIATEAGRACVNFGFSELKLNRIIAMCLPENMGSIRVLEKLGFNYEKDMLDRGNTVKLLAIKKD